MQSITHTHTKTLGLGLIGSLISLVIDGFQGVFRENYVHPRRRLFCLRRGEKEEREETANTKLSVQDM